MGKRLLAGVDRHGESLSFVANVTDPENPSCYFSFEDRISGVSKLIHIHCDDLDVFERALRRARRDMLEARGEPFVAVDEEE